MAKPTKAPKQATKTIKRAIGDGGGVSPWVALKRIRK
jgi:phage-related tail fiber protein